MQRIRNRGARSGFTLVELLCVMAIITVLAGLLLGPAGRALRKANALRWANDAKAHLDTTLDQLRSHYQGRQAFPPVTLSLLEANRLLGPAQIQFLKDPRVTFTPFSCTDPEAKLVITVQVDAGLLGWSNVMTVTKGQITRPPR